jgi:hypothetical protein
MRCCGSMQLHAARIRCSSYHPPGCAPNLTQRVCASDTAGPNALKSALKLHPYEQLHSLCLPVKKDSRRFICLATPLRFSPALFPPPAALAELAPCANPPVRPAWAGSIAVKGADRIGARMCGANRYTRMTVRDTRTRHHSTTACTVSRATCSIARMEARHNRFLANAHNAEQALHWQSPRLKHALQNKLYSGDPRPQRTVATHKPPRALQIVQVRASGTRVAPEEGGWGGAEALSSSSC